MKFDMISEFLLKHFWQAGLFYLALKYLLFNFLVIVFLWLIVEFIYRKSKLKDSKQTKLSSGFVLKLILLTQLIPLIVCFIFMAIKIDLIHGIDLRETLRFSANKSNALIMLTLVSFSSFIATLYVLFKQEIRKYIGLEFLPMFKKSFLYVVGGLAILYTPMLIWPSFFCDYESWNAYKEMAESFNTITKVILLGIVIVSTSVGEEIFFRGVIYTALKERIGFVSALVLQSFIFALIHINIIYVFLFAIISTLIYEKTKSLYPSIGFHFFHNLIVWTLIFAR